MVRSSRFSRPPLSRKLGLLQQPAAAAAAREGGAEPGAEGTGGELAVAGEEQQQWRQEGEEGD